MSLFFPHNFFAFSRSIPVDMSGGGIRLVSSGSDFLERRGLISFSFLISVVRREQKINPIIESRSIMAIEELIEEAS